uniref:Oncostatin M receptor n=1 Tax=Chrysemys picta bellii TaxID=8478 RepID=A0A8C3H995_CHRPI|nr:oncostatin-M-specific receptor subunit beta isoform X1 [Chrysemys picta bellii]XP_008166923.1 oncostatin-M-specific receptor subunit beta isoform X1 [Chrysemys picta bellii]XP_008166924.1 oncostatin-M-specific receptor subunit beta isoform X1 [Chrysemys picta bellii]
MDHFVLQTILLYTALCFSIYQGQETQEFLPTFLKVSKNLSMQRLLVEWDVSDLAHKFELEMVFDIQVSRSEEMNVVWTEYYNTTLSKLNKTLHWSWDSELPLECMSHSVRIRSMVNDERFSKIWSRWSQWETVLGLDTSDDNTSYIFPEDKVVEEGSNVTFCCIGGKDSRILNILFNYTDYYYPDSNTSQRNMVITRNKVLHAEMPDIPVICNISGKGSKNYSATLLYVGKRPYEPKDLSCDTRDMKTLTCTWNPGENTYLYGSHSTKYHLFERFSQKTLCYQKTATYLEPIHCSWAIDQQMIYNLTLTAQNALGERSANFVLDVAQRVHPSPPSDLSVEHMKATEVSLYWSMQPKHKAIKLLCQMENRHPSGQVELHNSSVVESNSYPHLTLGGLLPFTNYAFRMRCGAASHFWKWSEWSKTLRVRTNEAAPSGKLDVWREVTPVWGGRNVTLFWKPFPDFRANGGSISFEISWEKLENASEPEHISISALQNSTTISIDNHSYKVSVAARNNITSSLPSVMIISRATDNGAEEKVDHTDLEEERVNGTVDGIYISWKATNAFDGYIVDWCNFPRSQHCDFQWKRFDFNTSSCLINSAAFMPGVRYSFRVYGSLANEDFFLGKKVGYTKELAPSINLLEEITEMTSHTVTITWDSYPINESQPGFIRGYHVYVKTMEEECSLKGSTKHALSDGTVLCKYTIENPEEKRYMVKHLVPGTTYALAVTAYTGGGETPIEAYIYVDTPHDSKIYLLVLLVIIHFVLSGVCFWNIKWVKDCCCSEIPNPNKSKVLSFNGLKLNSEAVMKLNDCIPDTIVLENTSEANTLQLWSHGTILESESKVINPSWVYFVQNEEGDLMCTQSAPEACTSFENLAYSSQTALGSSLYQNLWMSEKSEPQLSILLYQPQHYIEILSKDTVPSLREITEREGSLRYISQMEVPRSEVKLSDLPHSTEPMEHSNDKIQTVLGSELVTSTSDEDVHSQDSSTSSNSAVLLLLGRH